MERPTLNALIGERISRRDFLLGGVGAGAATALPLEGVAAATPKPAPLTFEEIPHSYSKTHVVAKGYDVQVLVRWGDTIIGEATAPFTGPTSAEMQQRQFGANCDYIAFMPLPLGASNSSHGLLCVNNEYVLARMTFAGYSGDADAAARMSQEEAEIEMSAVGHSIVEVRREAGAWKLVAGSAHNRRITAMTPIELTGPAAGHPRLMTAADPTGRKVLGTLANCAGGVTPWGTVLSAEENFQDYFWGDLRDYLKATNGLGPNRIPEQVERRNHQMMGIGEFSAVGPDGKRIPPARPPFHGWYRFDPRFDINKEPFEANRFGYVVEIDPYDPQSTPKKRTALGRFRHENATVHAVDGKPVVVYSGDDAVDQYIYRFVSRGIYRAGERAHNMDLLADGDLYAARFEADGSGRWIKLEFGAEPLSEASTGLQSPAEVFIDTRLAASRLGATPMDRPEDIEVSPVTGRIYTALTREPLRTAERAKGANPRAQNLAGHIIEILPPGGDGARDHWADEFRWEILLLAGDPKSAQVNKRGHYHARTSAAGWFVNPDNLACDSKGRLWIATDGFNDWIEDDGTPGTVHDGLWACEVTGPNRALTRHFFGCPAGAEAAGPCFTPDGTTLFLSVQHPGDASWANNVAAPATRWPDFDADVPPRASVVAITKKGGGGFGA